MWKKLLIIMIVVAILSSCGKKGDAVPEGVVSVETRFFPLPDFAEIFSSLDHLPRANFDSAIPDDYATDINDVYVASYYLGNLTADAIIATKARNKTKLTSIANGMMQYSKMIGINDEVLKLADELMVLVQNDQWDKLQTSLEEYKTTIELALYETNQFDLMTLLQAGGWATGVNAICHLLKDNYDEAGTAILNQKGIVNNIVNNLGQMTNTDIYQNAWFMNIKNSYDEISKIICVEGKETFTAEEIAKLYQMSYL